MAGGISGVFGLVSIPADLVVMAWLQVILLVDIATLFKANLKTERARKPSSYWRSSPTRTASTLRGMGRPQGRGEIGRGPVPDNEGVGVIDRAGHAAGCRCPHHRQRTSTTNTSNGLARKPCDSTGDLIGQRPSRCLHGSRHRDQAPDAGNACPLC